jgi:muconate cycloisomerase
VDYQGKTPHSICAQIEGVRGAIEAGVSRAELMHLLPAGGRKGKILMIAV